MITVLVTGAGGGVGQGIIKSLKMTQDLEIKVITADMSELAAGLYAGDIACLVEGYSSSTYMDSLARIIKSESQLDLRSNMLINWYQLMLSVVTYLIMIE